MLCKSLFCKMNNVADWIGQKHPLQLDWNNLKWINNRRAIEQGLDEHFPYLRKITEFHIERRGDEGKRQN